MQSRINQTKKSGAYVCHDGYTITQVSFGKPESDDDNIIIPFKYGIQFVNGKLDHREWFYHRGALWDHKIWNKEIVQNTSCAWSYHKPSFLGIGAMKSGTSSIHSYLSQHPYVFVPHPKETDWFLANYEPNLDYENLFDDDYDEIGEIAPNYQHHYILEKILSFYPEMKIILCVRNPLKRFISAMRHLQSSNNNEHKLEAIFSNIEENSIVKQGNYKETIQTILASGNPLHIINFDDIVNHQTQVKETLCDFLSVTRYYHHDYYFHINSSRKNKFKSVRLSKKQENILKDYYHVSNKFLKDEYNIEMNL